MTPRSHAIAFRVWAHCTPIGWDCTIAEAAEGVGETTQRVRKIVTDKGWASRFRAADVSHWEVPRGAGLLQ